MFMAFKLFFFLGCHYLSCVQLPWLQMLFYYVASFPVYSRMKSFTHKLQTVYPDIWKFKSSWYYCSYPIIQKLDIVGFFLLWTNVCHLMKYTYSISNS